MARSKGKGKKKGKKGAGGGKKKMKPVPEGLALNEMSRKQLRNHIRRLFVEIDREREERNFFMLEREKQFLFWNFLLEQIGQEKDRARLLEVSFDDTEREKDKEMKIWKQKLRRMMGEQTEKLAMARFVNMYKMKRIQDEIWEIVMMLRDGIVEKHRQWRAIEASKYGILHMLQQNHADEITALRDQFTNEVKRMSEATEREAAAERKRVDERNAGELRQIRSEKEEQIEGMLYMHEKQLLEMKTYYNDLEVNNMAVISTYQQEIALKKLQEKRLQNHLKHVQKQHQSLLIPIQNFEDAQSTDWAEDESEIEKVKKDLAAGEKQLAQNNKYIRIMGCANEALLQKGHCIEKERNALRHCFTQSVINNQVKGTMGRMVAGLRNRAEDAGYTVPLPKERPTNVKKRAVCKALEPLFKKAPFVFNECVFPDITAEPHPYCRAIQSSHRAKRFQNECDQNLSTNVLPPRFLPPLPSKSGGGVKFGPTDE